MHRVADAANVDCGARLAVDDEFDDAAGLQDVAVDLAVDGRIRGRLAGREGRVERGRFGADVGVIAESDAVQSLAREVKLEMYYTYRLPT